MATIKDVARMAGVSMSTISKFLNGGNVREENAAAIREAITALDYRVNPFARSLKAQRSRSRHSASGYDSAFLWHCCYLSGQNDA